MSELNVAANIAQAPKAIHAGFHAFEFKVVRSASGARKLSRPRVLTDEQLTDMRVPSLDDAAWAFTEQTARLAGLID